MRTVHSRRIAAWLCIVVLSVTVTIGQEPKQDGGAERIDAPPPAAIEPQPGKKLGTIVFVLDCSGSMAQPLDAAGRPTFGRINAARAALSGILEQLATHEQYDVGLWLYGHRVGISGAGEGLVWNEAWGPRDATLMPSDDVARVIDVQPLNSDSLASFAALLKDNQKVRPFGRTPLYRSIVDAVATDLASQPRDLRRQLVVITDGENQVSQAGDPWQPTVGSLRTEADVIQALARDTGENHSERIKLDIIGVQSGPQTQLAALVQDPAVRGVYHSVTDLSLLKRELAAALDLNLTNANSLTVNVRYGERPVAGAKVNLDGPKKLELTDTRGAGAVTFTDLPPGEYKVSATGTARNGERAGAASVVIQTPQTRPATVTIALE